MEVGLARTWSLLVEFGRLNQVGYGISEYMKNELDEASKDSPLISPSRIGVIYSDSSETNSSNNLVTSLASPKLKIYPPIAVP